MESPRVYSDAEKLAYVRAYEDSDQLTQKAFCEQQGLRYSTFRHWYRAHAHKARAKLDFCQVTAASERHVSIPSQHHIQTFIHCYLPNGHHCALPTTLPTEQLSALLRELGVI